jgi:hypothetical protein
MNPEERRGLFASGSAVVAAIGASSCCILPLFLGSLEAGSTASRRVFRSACDRSSSSLSDLIL